MKPIFHVFLWPLLAAVLLSILAGIHEHQQMTRPPTAAEKKMITNFVVKPGTAITNHVDR